MRILWLAPLLLAGCADQPPLSPEGRAALLQYMMQQRPIQAQMLPPLTTPQQRFCTTTDLGNGQYRSICQ